MSRGLGLSFAIFAALSLAGGAACAADEPGKTDPDIGFLEFLGSVDGLAELNPDYLWPDEGAKPARPGVPGTTAPAPGAPPQPPPPSASAHGVLPE